WAYMETGDPYKAVVLGEYLCHSMSKESKAAAGGLYALQAYAKMISDPAAEAKWQVADTERMHRLALYMETTFPTDPNTDGVRYRVGTMLLRQPANPKEAAAILSRVTDNFKPASALAEARYWWADAAKKMLSEKISDKEKQFYQQQRIKALKGI